MPTHDVTPADAETERMAPGPVPGSVWDTISHVDAPADSWSPLLADSTDGSDVKLTAAHLQDVDWQGTPLVTSVSADHVLVVMPMDPYLWQRAAIGVLYTSDLRLAERLAAGRHRLLQQQLLLTRQGRELTTCLEQLTFSMEEQTWPRTLSRRIDLSDSRVGGGANRVGNPAQVAIIDCGCRGRLDLLGRRTRWKSHCRVGRRLQA